MEDYTRKRKEVGEIAEMEEVKRDRVLMRRTGMEISSSSFSKRIKISSDVELLNHSVMNSPEEEDSVSPAISETSDHVPASQCSSNESSELVVMKHSSISVDLNLKPKSFETENSTFNNVLSSRETTPTSDLSGELSEEMESTTSKPASASLRRKSPAEKMPSTAEIEEFFSAAEEFEQKRFADKYNYDFAKDVPLEGRYQWVRLKP